MTIDTLNLAELKGLPDEGPVILLNLLKFRERSADGNGSGWDAYLRYSALASPMIKARGGTILWTGTAEALALGVPEQDYWDFVALVRYPSRAAFIDLMSSPDYEAKANPHRENGTLKHVLLVVRESYSKFAKP